MSYYDSVVLEEPKTHFRFIVFIPAIQFIIINSVATSEAMEIINLMFTREKKTEVCLLFNLFTNKLSIKCYDALYVKAAIAAQYI